jgi:O-antigen ligase
MAENTGRQYITAKTIWYAVYLLAIVGLSTGLCLPHPFYLISFAIPAVVLLVVLTVTRPYIGLLIYSVFFLVRPHEFVGVLVDFPFPIERSFAALLLAVMIIKLILRARAAVELRNIDYALMIFLGVALLSVPVSIWIDNAWTTWMKLFRLFVVYVLIIQIIDTKGQLKFFVLFIVLTSAFHASASVVNYYRGIVEFRMGIQRAMGLDSSYGNPNSLAATMVYTLPFIYYIFTKYRSLLMKLLLIGVTGVMLWCIILTGSRTGMAGVLFLSILIIWQSRHRVVSLAAVFILVLVTWTVMPDQYKSRFESTVDLESETGAAQSARGRIEGFLNGVKMFIDRPILGYGIGNFGVATGLVYHEGWHQSHSLPGQMLGELGLLGCLAFIIWMYYLFRNLRILSTVYTTGARPDKFFADTALALKLQLFCLFFMGLGGHNLYRLNWFVIAALVGVMLKIYESESRDGATLTGLSSRAVEAQGESI